MTIIVKAKKREICTKPGELEIVILFAQCGELFGRGEDKPHIDKLFVSV
jgi:hypothetical protein